MNNSSSYPYQFEKHPKKKGVCPGCNHKGTFRYYEDLPREFGRCERINQCTYHHKPDGTIEIKPIYNKRESTIQILYPEDKECLLILNDRTSPFHLFCEKILSVSELHLRKWGVGSRTNAITNVIETAFILRNVDHTAINIKFFQYDQNCKRSKNNYPYYLSSKAPSAKYKTCFFGEHLLASKAAKKIVCLVESEKTAVIASYFYPHFDWLATGGNNGLSNEKFNILIDRVVYYLIDADNAGRENSTLKKLKSFSINFSVIELFPARTDGYDLADAIIEGLCPPINSPDNSILVADTKDDNHANLSHLEENSVNKSVLPFPLEIYPLAVRDYVQHGSHTLNYPLDFVAVSVLVALSTAIGNTFRIEIKKGWQDRAILFAALIGDSGVRKTHSINFSLAPLFKQHDILRKEYAKQMNDYKGRLENEILNEGGKLDKPICQQLYSTDATMEAIIKMVNENPKGFLYYKDELLGWIREFDRYRKGSDEQQWLSIWSGSDINLNRKTATEPLFAKSPFVNILGGLQPDYLEDIFKEKRNASGFTVRLLFCFPDPIKRQYTEEEMPSQLVDKYWDIFSKIFSILTRLDDIGNLQPYILKFESKAQKRFEQWCEDEINKLINNQNSSSLEKSILSKLEAYCTRFALILQITNWACGNGNLQVIEQTSLDAAIKLCQYFKSHAFKVHNYVKESAPDNLFKIISWIKQNGGKATKRDLYRQNVAGIYDERQAHKYIQILVQKGYGKIKICQPKTGGHTYEEFILE